MSVSSALFANGAEPGPARTGSEGESAFGRAPAGPVHTVAVIGVGYVGLPTAATLAHLGHKVTCGDADPRKVEMLQRGEVPIVEEHLEDLVREGQRAGNLRFVLGATAAIADAEFVFLCVPTPQGDDGSADLSYVEAVAAEISPHLTPGTIIVNKSTVPVGSTLVVERVLGRTDVQVVSNPEFLREGTAVPDSLHPERIVVGADDQAAAARVGDGGGSCCCRCCCCRAGCNLRRRRQRRRCFASRCCCSSSSSPSRRDRRSLGADVASRARGPPVADPGPAAAAAAAAGGARGAGAGAGGGRKGGGGGSCC